MLDPAAQQDPYSAAPLPESVGSLPDKPGVYLMKNAAKKIIYIGKAKSLVKRVRSYFTGVKDIKTRILMQNVADVETIITRNEYEALLLENSLIKQWAPRFNINLKDGKSYPVIRVTNEQYPRVFRTRRLIFDGSSYFGPFPNAGGLDLYLELIEKLFPLRKCRGKLKKRQHPSAGHPCLYYHIGRCSAPCTGKIGREEYAKLVEEIKQLLSGRTKQLIQGLTRKRDEAARSLEFERAALLRDQMQIIEGFTEGQRVIDYIEETRDYVGYAAEDNLCSFVVLKMREGSLVDKEVFRTEVYSDPEEALGQFILQYYTKIHNPPSVVYLPPGSDPEALSAYLSDLLRRRIKLTVSRWRRHSKLINMASENARQDILARSREKEQTENLRQLSRVLGLAKTPVRIEGFDIAHLSGQDTVASMVSFSNGKPDKKSYRHFKLRTLKGKIDDYEAMREIIARRYSRVLNEGLDRPDLILVDGGKGQVSAALSVLESLGLRDIPLAGLAKEKEEIFLPDRSEPIVLAEGSAALQVLQAVRNESHRFATGFHKRLRNKRATQSIFEEVRGIGKRKSQRLLEAFGSFGKILNSSPEDLMKKGGLNRDTALALVEMLKRKQESGRSGLLCD